MGACLARLLLARILTSNAQQPEPRRMSSVGEKYGRHARPRMGQFLTPKLVLPPQIGK